MRIKIDPDEWSQAVTFLGHDERLQKLGLKLVNVDPVDHVITVRTEEEDCADLIKRLEEIVNG